MYILSHRIIEIVENYKSETIYILKVKCSTLKVDLKKFFCYDDVFIVTFQGTWFSTFASTGKG